MFMCLMVYLSALILSCAGSSWLRGPFSGWRRAGPAFSCGSQASLAAEHRL